jgi:hypothetical protein
MGYYAKWTSLTTCGFQGPTNARKGGLLPFPALAGLRPMIDIYIAFSLHLIHYTLVLAQENPSPCL